MGGQSSEEAAEKVATIRGEHVVMKNWFMGDTKEAVELREKYGDYPALWKEVLNWPGWKDARKAYLRFTQGAAGPPKNSNDDSAGGVPRKRRSRWGVASSDDINPNNNTDSKSNNSNGHQPPSKRRSRWGRDGPGDGGNNNAPPPPPPPPAAPMMKPLPGLGLPGMPTNLPQSQQGEFRQLQSRLREINEKLDNLEREAARVDALPRGHRDRSPSPPPSKLIHICRRCWPN